MPARALMFQGTGSDVGKSLIVAGLARAFTRRGLRGAPFKPQNMSNNAAVTEDGGEIGRAQALQARAAGIAPSVHMNPVLLKPQSEIGAQIVVQGRVFGNAKARRLSADQADLLPYVLDSFARLRDEADLVLVEGAGSAAEINLRANDIANMGFARAADVPVVLIGDIDRGGVIASLVGTKAVIDGGRCRADLRLHRQQISRRSGAVRSRHGAIAQRPAGSRSAFCRFFRTRACCRRKMRWRSSSAARQAERAPAHRGADPATHRQFRRSRSARGRARGGAHPRAAGAALPGDADLVVLPGSKATIADLAALRATGFDIDIAAHRRRGGMSSAFAAAIRCWGAASPIRTASKARPARSPVWACSM